MKQTILSKKNTNATLATSFTLRYDDSRVYYESDGDIMGIQIRYSGNSYITQNEEINGSDFLIMAHNKNIIIISLTGMSIPNYLFDYTGYIEIKSLIVANNKGERTKTDVKYDKVVFPRLVEATAEELDSTPEQMTNKKYKKRHKPKQVVSNNYLISNTDSGMVIKLKNGIHYEGKFSIDLNTGIIYSGSPHDDNLVALDASPIYRQQKGKKDFSSTTENGDVDKTELDEAATLASTGKKGGYR